MEKSLSLSFFPQCLCFNAKGSLWSPVLIKCLCQYRAILISQPSLSNSPYPSVPHKTRALEWACMVSLVREHWIPCSWATDSFSFAFHLGLGRGLFILGENLESWYPLGHCEVSPSSLPQEFQKTLRAPHGKALSSLWLERSLLVTLRRRGCRRVQSSGTVGVYFREISPKGKVETVSFFNSLPKKKKISRT